MVNRKNIMKTNNLKSQAISGVIWSAAQQFGTQIIAFLSNLVLARLLSPDDYGCIGLLAIFIAISNVFIMGGFVSALIQKKDATDIDYNTAFYWNIVVSLAFYALLYFIAPLIASFYGIPTLCDILRILGFLVIISGFSVVQNTILRKTFQFNKLARIDIISAIISVSVSIMLAFNGWGVWSLVAQQLISRICRCIFLWYGTTWHPSLVFSTKAFKSMFSYGSFLLLSDLLNSLVDNVQGVIIGKKYDASDMGYYTQAKKMEEVPTQSISQLVAQVTFPLYSKIQDNKENLYKAVKESLSLMNYINFPLMILLIVIAKPLFFILYSEKWMGSVEYFQILCVGGITNCAQSVNYQVVSAVGRSRDLFKWNIIKRCIGLLLMLIGMLFSLKGILWGMVISMYVTFYINARLAQKNTGYSVMSQMKDCFPLLIYALISGGITYILSIFVVNNVLLLFTQSCLYIGIYFLFSYIGRRIELFELIDIFLNLFNRIKKIICDRSQM